MNFYYTEHECNKAIATAIEVINEKAIEYPDFRCGTNDCAYLLIEYDKALRGASNSKADIGFSYSNTREFLVKLKRSGYTVEEYLEHCGYQIVKNKRPKLGDVAFAGGAMVATPKGWISTTEKGAGVIIIRQMMYIELKTNVIARPIRS